MYLSPPNFFHLGIVGGVEYLAGQKTGPRRSLTFMIFDDRPGKINQQFTLSEIIFV